MIDAYLNSSGAGTEYAGIGNLIGAPIVSFLVVVPAVVLVILIVGWMREAKRPGSVGVAAAASLVWLLLLSSVAFGFRGERSRDTSSSAQRHLTQVEQAIADNDLEGVRRAVRLGGGVKDSDLAASVSNDRIAIARFLVERGARDPDGIALKSAARLLYPDMVELILHADPFNDPDFYSTVTRDPWDAKNRVRIIDDMIATHAVVNPREMSATERRTLESFRAKSAAIHADIDRH
jgi:hypothetical protein